MSDVSLTRSNPRPQAYTAPPAAYVEKELADAHGGIVRLKFGFLLDAGFNYRIYEREQELLEMFVTGKNIARPGEDPRYSRPGPAPSYSGRRVQMCPLLCKFVAQLEICHQIGDPEQAYGLDDWLAWSIVDPKLFNTAVDLVTDLSNAAYGEKKSEQLDTTEAGSGSPSNSESLTPIS